MMIKIRNNNIFSNKLWGKKVITGSELAMFPHFNWNNAEKYFLELVIYNHIKKEGVNLWILK